MWILGFGWADCRPDLCGVLFYEVGDRPHMGYKYAVIAQEYRPGALNTLPAKLFGALLAVDHLLFLQFLKPDGSFSHMSVVGPDDRLDKLNGFLSAREYYMSMAVR